jgi:hypothetical protein
MVDFGWVIGAWGWSFFVMLPGIALLVLAFVGARVPPDSPSLAAS